MTAARVGEEICGAVSRRSDSGWRRCRFGAGGGLSAAGTSGYSVGGVTWFRSIGCVVNAPPWGVAELKRLNLLIAYWRRAASLRSATRLATKTARVMQRSLFAMPCSTATARVVSARRPWPTSSIVTDAVADQAPSLATRVSAARLTPSSRSGAGHSTS